MSEERINPLSGKRQIKIEPEGLPAIWVEAEVCFCERCHPYNECLHFSEISEKQWRQLNNLLDAINKEEVKIKPSYCHITHFKK